MNNKIAGCLIGLALGDALGAPTEFMDMARILGRYPPDGIQELPTPARVTDDTQMAIAVAKALVEAPRPYATDSLAAVIENYFIDWYYDPENTRAPGNTCMNSIFRLITGQPWHMATSMRSKGCGANMRVQAVGLLPVDESTRTGIAQLQAAITHAHPTALAASDLTAWVIADLLHNGDINTLVDRAIRYAQSQRHVYHDNWLGQLYERTHMVDSPEAYIERGWDECLQQLDKVKVALIMRDTETDPCELVGASWIAEEAFATALYCFLLYPDDPVEAMRRGANSSGDSDSIACIVGAFAGVHNGLSALPVEWVQRIEYRDTLARLATDIAMMY